MKIVKLLRMGALLAAAIAFVGCEMTLNDEDSRKEVVEAKAKANADKGSGNGNGGGSTGTDSSLPVIYVGLGGENTFNLTSVKVGDKEQTIKNSTLKPSTWNAISEFETVQVKKGSSVSFTFTQTAAGASVWNTWALAIYDNATASEAKGNFVRGDNWLNKSVDAGFKAGLWSEGGATAGGAYSNEYTSETAGKALTSSDTVVIKVEYTDSGVKITETINEKLAYTAEGAFTSSTPAPTTDNSSQAENTGTNNSGNNGNNNSGNTENNNNSGNNGNNDSGNNGNNNSGNTENNNNSGNSGTTIPTQTDYVVGTEDNTTSWSAGKNYTIAKGETQTVYFKNYGKRTGVYNPGEGVDGYGNWNNFLVELFNADSDVCGVTLRADNFGWNYGESTNREFSWANEVTTGSKLPDNWAAWVAAMNGATVKLEVSYKEGTITFKATSADVAGWAQVYSFANCTSDSLSWHFNVDKSYLVVLK